MRKYVPSDYMVDAITNAIDERDGEYVHVEDLPHWIPVSERLPEPQRNVLLSSTTRKCRIMRLIDGVSECYWADDTGLTASLFVYEYWMPLPEPPEVQR